MGLFEGLTSSRKGAEGRLHQNLESSYLRNKNHFYSNVMTPKVEKKKFFYVRSTSYIVIR